MITLESTNHFSEGYVTTIDNLKIYYKKLKPENPTKNIIIIPGFGATATMFLGMQHFFYEQGYCAIIVELRGHGFSDGTPGHVEKHDDYLKDINAIIDNVNEKNIPTVICGHSNGGLVATNFAIKNQEKYESLVLISPWYALTKPLTWYELALVNLANQIFPKFTASMEDRGGLSSGCTTNTTWQNVLNVDKQIHKFASARLNYEVQLTQQYCFGNCGEIENKNILIIHPKNDPVTSHESSLQMFGVLSRSQNKKFISLDKFIHHPFLEEDVKSLFNDILNFIK